MNFIDLCLGGDVLEDEIDDFVGNWHEDESTTQELHEYLGMTWGEYSLWAAKPSILPFILAARKKGTQFDVEINHERLAFAARAGSAQEATKLEAWLRLIGIAP